MTESNPKNNTNTKTGIKSGIKSGISVKEKIFKEAVNPAFKLSQEDREVIDALDHFEKTGEVKPPLLPGFDQTGTWIGVWHCPYIENYTNNISKYILDKTRTTKIDKAGNIHLLTSFSYQSNGKGLRIDYTTVGGVLNAPTTKFIHAPNLTTVYGKIDLSKCTNCSMPELEKVCGFLNLGAMKFIQLPKLQEIEGMLNAYNARNIEIPKLREVQMIKFENCVLAQKSKILSRLSKGSLVSFKEKIYEESTLSLIKTELTKRQVTLKIKESWQEEGVEI